MAQLGKYDILAELGRGGFGIVYKARDRSLDRLTALKVLHPQLTVDASFITRFRKEARDLARINHPNVVTIHEIGEVEGHIYIAMEYLPGGSLDDRLSEEPLSLEDALKITSEVSAGLGAGHEEGLIHRDVKPGNILFNKHGEAVVADFGLAKALQISSSSVRSSVGAVGTPYYRAPELWNGTPPPSPATDVYALACVFYEMVTGQILFDGDTPMIVITKHAHGPDFPSDTDLSARLLKVLEKALTKDPSQRYQSMKLFVKALTQSQLSQPESEQEIPIKQPEPVVQQTAAEVKPTRVQKSSSQMGAESSFEKPVVKSSRVDREYSKTSTRMEGKKNTKWLLWGGLGIVGVVGVIVVIVLIGIWITNLGVGNRPAQEAPVAEQPAEEEDTEANEVVVEGYQAGDQKTNTKDSAEMVFVPAGDFLMGSEDSDADDDEDPEHTVYLEAYWIYKHEVTNEQYTEFVEETGYKTDAEDRGWSYVYEDGSWEGTSGAYWAAPGGPGSDVDSLGNYPVIHVSWNDAAAYCEWAGGRLPTEAEWEKAARGEDGLKFPWGNTDVTGTKANYCDENCEFDWRDSDQDDGFVQTAPVGSYPAGASPYGALDMAGNVREWVADWYDADYYDKSPGSNPKGPDDTGVKVLRGGSCSHYVRSLRASPRHWADPDDAGYYAGFRCFRSSEPSN